MHVLMQNKTEDLYTLVVLKLRELIPEFSPKIAVSDFEKAPKRFYPGLKISGRWFHFTKPSGRKHNR